MGFRKYLEIMAATCCFCLFLAAFVSYFGDSGCMFNHRDKVKEVLEMLEKGHTVTNIEDLDLRTLQILHGSSKELTDILVLGSSRSMGITQSMFSLKLWNASVGSASLEDLEHCYRLHNTPPVCLRDRDRPLDFQFP